MFSFNSFKENESWLQELETKEYLKSSM